MKKTEADSIIQSCVVWNISRVCFLIDALNIKFSELVNILKLDGITASQLRAFAKGKTDILDEDQLWSLHYKIDKFFLPWN